MEKRSDLRGIGVDLVDMRDIKKIRFTKRFCELFLTRTELKQIPINKNLKNQFIASRFAVKEAVIKAFPQKISPLEFEIRKDQGKPFVHFLSKEKRESSLVLVSISHTNNFATGFAVALNK